MFAGIGDEMLGPKRLQNLYAVLNHLPQLALCAMTETIERIVLASRPVGEPTLDNFRSEELPIPQPGPGEMLLRSTVGRTTAPLRLYVRLPPVGRTVTYTVARPLFTEDMLHLLEVL
jgi:hypothetical protein